MEAAEKARWDLATRGKTLGLENKGKRSQIDDDDIWLRSTCYFLCINLEEWMANGGVALQGNGHRQVDGTYSETYVKLFLNMP